MPLTKEQITTLVNQIKNETTISANTASRVGNALNALNDNKPNTDELSSLGPNIGGNGNWFIGSVDTGIVAQGPAGPAGVDGAAGPAGADGAAGPAGADGADGADGNTPYIQTGTWWIGGVDTGINATGPEGPEGPAGSPDTTQDIINKLNAAVSPNRLPVTSIEDAEQDYNGDEFQEILGVFTTRKDIEPTQGSPRFVNSGNIYERLRKRFVDRTGEQINFNREGSYGNLSEPLLEIEDMNLSVGEDNNSIIVYSSQETIPQFVTDLGLGASYSTLLTDVNWIQITKVDDNVRFGTLQVFSRGDSIGQFVFLEFEDVIDPTMPATLTDSGNPGLILDIDVGNYAPTYNLGPVFQSIGLGNPISNAGSFLELDRINPAVATFLDGFTVGFGLAFWAKRPTTSDTEPCTVYASDGNFDGTGIRVNTLSTTGQLLLHVKSITNASSPQRIGTTISDVLINDGEWNHWVVSWRQSDGQAIIWKNGAVVVTGTIIADTGVSLHNAFINRSPIGNSREIWYDDYKLRPANYSQAEVNVLYSQGNRIFANAPKVLATEHLHLKFQDSIDPLPVYFRDSGSNYIYANYHHGDGGTVIESDGSKQAIQLGLPQVQGGSRLIFDLAKNKTAAFFNTMSEAFTIAFRVKVKPDSINTSRIFFSSDGIEGAAFNGAGIRISCLGSNGQVQMYVGANDVTPTDNRLVTTLSNVILNDDVYSNWVFTYDRATSTAKIYKNGVEAASSNTIVVDNTSNFVVGTVNPIIGHGPAGTRYGSVWSHLVIAPRVLNETERSQIFM
jgi:hypothetical protein